MSTQGSLLRRPMLGGNVSTEKPSGFMMRPGATMGGGNAVFSSSGVAALEQLKKTAGELCLLLPRLQEQLHSRAPPGRVMFWQGTEYPKIYPCMQIAWLRNRRALGTHWKST